jgi:hypothetical protein
MSRKLSAELRTFHDVWSGYAVTVDARRRVMLGVRHEPRLPLAFAEPWPLMTRVVCLAGPAGMTLQQLRSQLGLLDTQRFERGLVQLRAGGSVVETRESRPDQAGSVPTQVVLRCR